MLLREKLVRAEEAAAALGIREVGGNNHGPEVKKFLAEVGLPEGYAWCDAYQSYEEHAAAGYRLPIESAGVAVTYAKARELGWLVGPNMSPTLYPSAFEREGVPHRGDLVLYDWSGSAHYGDHIGIVTAATAIAGGFDLHTVEGNTGDGNPGDGDGVYLRERQVTRLSAAYVRIPGTVPDAVAIKAKVARAAAARPAAKPAPKPKPAAPAKPMPILHSGVTGPAVGTLQTLLNKHGATLAVDNQFGPHTLTAVANFQTAKKLQTDGVVGPHTWAALKEAK